MERKSRDTNKSKKTDEENSINSEERIDEKTNKMIISKNMSVSKEPVNNFYRSLSSLPRSTLKNGNKTIINDSDGMSVISNSINHKNVKMTQQSINPYMFSQTGFSQKIFDDNASINSLSISQSHIVFKRITFRSLKEGLLKYIQRSPIYL